MGTSNVELYEALKPKIGKDGARMIAEVLPATSDLATRADIDRLETRIAEMETRLLRWTLGFFAPLWAAVLAPLVTLLLRA